jgi:hypothetical protein
MDKLIVYHGTSLLYIPYILKNGLTGRYPDELYEELLFFWNKVTNKESNPKVTYIDSFLQRQIEVRQNNKIEISLTKQYYTALEYANGARTNGEGPGYIMDAVFEEMNEIKKNGPSISDRLDNLLELFGLEPKKNIKGIVLAFKASDLIDSNANEDKQTMIADLLTGKHHYVLYPFPIPPSIINIAISENNIVPISSPQGMEYLNSLTSSASEVLKSTLSDETSIGNDIKIFLDSKPSIGKMFIMPKNQIGQLSQFKIGTLVGDEDSEGFDHYTSHMYDNFEFLLKKNNGDIILKIVPKIVGGKLKKYKSHKRKTNTTRKNKRKINKRRKTTNKRRKITNKRKN